MQQGRGAFEETRTLKLFSETHANEMILRSADF